MSDSSASPCDDLTAIGAAALNGGRWAEARDAFEASLAERATRPTPASAWRWPCGGWARTGPASSSAPRRTRSFRRAGDVAGAVDCALWLAITYKANFANFAAANGWIARAERLLEPLDRRDRPTPGSGSPGPTGWRTSTLPRR